MAEQQPTKKPSPITSSSLTNSPKKPPTSQKKNSLSLTPNSLDRHPSAIHLGEQKEEDLNIKPPSFSGVNVILANPDNNDNLYQFNLSSTENKVYEGTETYFTPNLEKSIQLTPIHKPTTAPNNAQKHNSFSFTLNQKIADEKITQYIQNGDGYDKVEETFSILHFMKKDT